MKGRLGQRARTDFLVRARNGRSMTQCRGIELSPTGIMLDRGRAINASDEGAVLELELHLPEQPCPLKALARPIWGFGSQQALKFIGLSDADRLLLAEHVDRMARRGRPMN